MDTSVDGCEVERLAPSRWIECWTRVLHAPQSTVRAAAFPAHAPRTSNKWNQQQVQPKPRQRLFVWFLAATERQARCRRSDSRGGNYIIIVPKHELVIAVTNHQIQPLPPRSDQYIDAVLDAMKATRTIFTP